MKRSMITLATVIVALFAASMVYAQDFGPGQGSGVCQFIDEDGTGNQFKYGSLGEMGGKDFGSGNMSMDAKAMALVMELALVLDLVTAPDSDLALVIALTAALPKLK